MDLEYHDRPKDGISFFETCISVIAAAIVTGVAIGAAYLAGRIPIDLDGAVTTAQHVAEADARHALPPAEIAYWRRHERNQELCRGQTYIAMCCEDAREDLTCLTHEDVR